jgi:hypothetical protein
MKTPTAVTHLDDADRPPEALTPTEKSIRMIKAIRREMKAAGHDDWDPLLRMAQVSEELAAEGDLKGAMQGFSQVASYWYAKPKSEESDQKGLVPQINLVLPAGTTQEKAIDGIQLPNTRRSVEQQPGYGRFDADGSPPPGNS